MSVEYRATIKLPGSKSEEEYGIECEEPDISKLDQLVGVIEAEQLSLSALKQSLGIQTDDQAVAYVPGVLLSRAPSKDEISTFNQDNTQSVASFVIGIQKELEKVSIHESNERLVYLPVLFDQHSIRADFSNTPFHEACGEWAGKGRQFWAREEFANRLVYMGALVNRLGARLRFEDAYRPVGVQEGLFKRRVAWTRRDHPDWSNAQVISEAQSKTAVKPKLASHKGGAAVDARLVDEISGETMDFGHEYPDGGALVFPQTSFITEKQWINRQMFQIASGLSDMMLYVGEDWHISYGDNLASLDSDGNVDPSYVAKYGPVKAFNPKNGDILSVYSRDELDNTFDF